ncbi:MAG: YitT family protein [Burkholderiales bacterium]|nr:YitT family protein [Burkholderiales bacterium]MBK6569540.1 YitT family protein [Burkholderiales bacterium]MBK7280963.1 YitT family protein [Burkholderiales bacterium]MBK7315760.1 YitT family protein [Burkholderiales bacterium]MBL0243190.1 YitT family protein [Rhodoferax sp.]
MQSSAPTSPRHRTYEDMQALFTGTLFVALGISMFGQTGLLTGGMTGVAFLLHYATGWNFGLLFFAVNVPFFGLAWKRMGKAFTVKTGIAVMLMTLLTNVLPKLVHFDVLNPVFSAIMGGLLMGAGMLILFRHRASLGGLNVLVLYLQERFGWRAGRIQMALDCAIVLCSFAVVEWWYTALSVLGAVVLNQTLATNHRAGRYMAL